MLQVTPQVEAAIMAGQQPINLVRFDFAGVAPIFLTTAGYDIDWDGETWLANGLLLDVDGYNRVNELRTKQGDIGLTGVDLSIAAILLSESQVNRKVTVYDAFLNTVSGAVIPDPYIRDIYFIDGDQIDQGLEDATVVLDLSGEWADFQVKKGIRTTDTSLRDIHEGDRLFQYSKDVKKEIRWGGK